VSTSTADRERALPHLLTMMSTSSVRSASDRTDSASVTSSVSAAMRGSSVEVGWRAVAYTLTAPCRTSASANARPRPRRPPVTSAVAPSILVIGSTPIVGLLSSAPRDRRGHGPGNRYPSERCLPPDPPRDAATRESATPMNAI
jgi:hypothetical protein